MELAVGHVSIVADTSRLPGQIKKSLGSASGYGSDVGSSIGSKISSGIGKTLKAGVAGVGVAAGGALAGSITKGLGRLTGIELVTPVIVQGMNFAVLGLVPRRNYKRLRI